MTKAILNISAVLIIILTLAFPAESLSYARGALGLCGNVIIPSLFPFFVCSGILVYSGFAETLARLFRPVMRPLFNVNENGAAAFVLGMISGYPTGAVTACQLYENAYLSKSETERLLAFCNNSGPLFIAGAVGTAMYKSPRIGLILYLSHLAAAILTGVIFRYYKRDGFSAPQSRLKTADALPSEIFQRVLASSINSILTVCGAVIFFFTVSGLILAPFRFAPAPSAFLRSLAELTGGMELISALPVPLGARLIVSSFSIGFAGLCVHIQVMSVTARYGLSLKPYILGKLLHGVLSAAVTLLFLTLSPPAEGVFKDCGAPLSGGFCFSSLYVTLAASAILLAAGLAPCFRALTSSIRRKQVYNAERIN